MQRSVRVLVGSNNRGACAMRRSGTTTASVKRMSGKSWVLQHTMYPNALASGRQSAVNRLVSANSMKWRKPERWMSILSICPICLLACTLALLACNDLTRMEHHHMATTNAAIVWSTRRDGKWTLHKSWTWNQSERQTRNVELPRKNGHLLSQASNPKLPRRNDHFLSHASNQKHTPSQQSRILGLFTGRTATSKKCRSLPR